MAESVVSLSEPAEIRMKMRFDFEGTARGKRLFFASKDTAKLAIENRERNVSLLKNIPTQGVYIEHINDALEPYSLYNEQDEEWVTYAPVEITLRASSLEDILHFILRDELRKVEIIGPRKMTLDGYNIERFLVRLHSEMVDAIRLAVKRQEKR